MPHLTRTIRALAGLTAATIVAFTPTAASATGQASQRPVKPSSPSCAWVDTIWRPVQHGPRLAVYVSWRQVDPCRKVSVYVALETRLGDGRWVEFDHRSFSMTHSPGHYDRTVTWPCPHKVTYRARATVVGSYEWLTSPPVYQPNRTC